MRSTTITAFPEGGASERQIIVIPLYTACRLVFAEAGMIEVVPASGLRDKGHAALVALKHRFRAESISFLIAAGFA
jgi:hypothetical protein